PHVPALPAHGLGVADAHHARLARGAIQRDRKLLGLLPGRPVGRDVRLREPARGRAYRRVLLTLEQVGHRSASIPTSDTKGHDVCSAGARTTATISLHLV